MEFKEIGMMMSHLYLLETRRQNIIRHKEEMPQSQMWGHQIILSNKEGLHKNPWIEEKDQLEMLILEILKSISLSF